MNTTLPLCRYVSTSVWPSDSTIERSAAIPIRLCGPMLIPRRSAATRIHRVCRVSGDILVTRCHKQLRRRHRSARPVGRRGGARGAASAGAAEQSRPRSPPPADSPRREVEPDERDPLVRVDDERPDAGSSLTRRARAGREPAEPLVPGHGGVRRRRRGQDEEERLAESALLEAVLRATAERAAIGLLADEADRAGTELVGEALEPLRAPAKSPCRRSDEPRVVR